MQGEGGKIDRQTHTSHENVTEGYKLIVKQKCKPTCSITRRTWDPNHPLRGVAVKGGFMPDFRPGHERAGGGEATGLDGT